MQESDSSGRSETALVDPERHVESFRQAREARRLELVEDYVELIDDLIGDGGEAGRWTSRRASGWRSRPSPRC